MYAFPYIYIYSSSVTSRGRDSRCMATFVTAFLFIQNQICNAQSVSAATEFKCDIFARRISVLIEMKRKLLNFNARVLTLTLSMLTLLC